MKGRNRSSISQSMHVGSIKSKGIVQLSQNASVDQSAATQYSWDEFREELRQLIAQLDEYTSVSLEVQQAQRALYAATEESNRRCPRPRKARQFLDEAQRLLERALTIGVPLLSLVDLISDLSQKVTTALGR